MYSPEHYFSSRFKYQQERDAVWRVICDYLKRFIPAEGRVLDIGAGYCSFINNVQAKEKHALDVLADFSQFAHKDIQTHLGSCSDLSIFSPGYFDVVFTSNVWEHLPRPLMLTALSEVRRVLKPGGRLIIIQPNFRYCFREYFDDYTHQQIFTHVTLVDLLSACGFTLEHLEARFLPLSFNCRLPKWPWLVRLYLGLPLRLFAQQMLVVARGRPIG